MKKIKTRQKDRDRQRNQKQRKVLPMPVTNRHHWLHDRNPKQQIFEHKVMWRLRQLHILLFGKNWKPKP